MFGDFVGDMALGTNFGADGIQNVSFAFGPEQRHDADWWCYEFELLEGLWVYCGCLGEFVEEIFEEVPVFGSDSAPVHVSLGNKIVGFG